jgi:hypothetical protein
MDTAKAARQTAWEIKKDKAIRLVFQYDQTTILYGMAAVPQ